MSKRCQILASIAIGLGIILVANGLLWGLLGKPTTGIDDSDIFFVYARHVAEGFGFVYNIGGESVEGFTSLSWTLLGATVWGLFQHFEFPLWMLNSLLGAVVVGTCMQRTCYRWGFLCLMLASPAWFVWCQITLMESGLWCFLLTMTGLAVMDGKNRSLLTLLPLLVITRPESMLWGVWVVLLCFVFAEKGTGFRKAAGPAVVFVVSLALLIGFRMSYFGYPVPNTYYAKVSPGLWENFADGLVYFFQYMISAPAVFLVLLSLVYALVLHKKEMGPSGRLALFLLPGIGIPILVGGDHFGAFRFYQPLWPLLCLVAVKQWPLVSGRVKPVVVKGTLGVLVLVGWMLFSLNSNLEHEFRIAREGRENGQILTALFSDLESWPTVGVITAGGNKLAYSGHVYDLMGLNSTAMAHAEGARGGFKNHTGFNRDVFYGWMPDVLLCGDSEEFDRMVLNGLQDEARFRVLYTKCRLLRNGTSIQAWFNNDFLMAIPERVSSTGSGLPVSDKAENLGKHFPVR